MESYITCNHDNRQAGRIWTDGQSNRQTDRQTDGGLRWILETISATINSNLCDHHIAGQTEDSSGPCSLPAGEEGRGGEGRGGEGREVQEKMSETIQEELHKTLTFLMTALISSPLPTANPEETGDSC